MEKTYAIGKREDAGGVRLLHFRVPDHPIAVFEYPQGRLPLLLDQRAEALGAGVDVHGSLCRENAFCGHRREDVSG